MSESQFGGLRGSSAVLALVNLEHQWLWSGVTMESSGKVVRIIFLNLRKAFDPVDHNKPLKNNVEIGVRPALIAWFGSYLQ